MSDPRPAIVTPQNVPPEVRRTLEPLAEVVNRVTGQAHAIPPIQMLAQNATNLDIIAKINELIARLQED